MMEDRDRIILAMRAEGATFAQIGARLQLSRGYAAWVGRRAEQRQAELAISQQRMADAAGDHSKILLSDLELSTRARICLRNTFGEDGTLADLARVSFIDLLRVPNLGHITVQEIETEAAKFGVSLASSPRADEPPEG